MKKLSQKGFSAIEGLLVLIAAVLIIFVGYYIYHAQKNTNNTYNAASKVSQSTPAKSSSKKAATSTQKYFTIKEWGVEAPYTGNLTLEYKIGSDNSEQYASFSSSQLDTQGGDCKADLTQDPGYGGLIERFKSTDHVYGEDGSDLGVASSYFADYDSDSQAANKFKQIGDYYYQYVHPQGACNDSQSAQDAETQADTAVLSLVENLQAIPN